MRTPPKQINRLEGTLRRRATAITLQTGTGAYNVTAATAGSASGGNDTTLGIYTAGPDNRVTLIRRDNGRAVEKKDGTRIFGRITFAATVFTVTLYISDGASAETPYVPIAADALNNIALDILYGETVRWETRKPTDVMNSLDSIDDVSVDVNSHQSNIETITPTANQTAFPLAQTPKAGSLTMKINGMMQKVVADYTLAGSTLTYTAADFALEITDVVQIEYDY